MRQSALYIRILRFSIQILQNRDRLYHQALCSMGYVNRKGEKDVISDKARPLFLEKGKHLAL